MLRVLLIPDFPNWALDKNAHDLIKYNPTDIEFDIAYIKDVLPQWQDYYKQYDLLFPMYIGLFLDFLRHRVPMHKVITGVRSFHRWDQKKTVPPGYNADPPRKIIHALRKALLVNTHCQKLWYIFAPYFPIIHTKYTCDLEMFYPDKKPRTTDKLIIGWTGSLTNHGAKRGFDDFIKPLCDQFPNVELKVQSKEDNFITDDNQMREFYNSLDLYICASRAEGTPRPVIEAAACGVPVLSTDVGIVPELLIDGENGFIVERNLREMKHTLKAVLSERERLPEMGDKLRQRMEAEFNWNYLIYQWLDFFRFANELKILKANGDIE